MESKILAPCNGFSAVSELVEPLRASWASSSLLRDVLFTVVCLTNAAGTSGLKSFLYAMVEGMPLCYLIAGFLVLAASSTAGTRRSCLLFTEFAFGLWPCSWMFGCTLVKSVMVEDEHEATSCLYRSNCSVIGADIVSHSL